MMRVALMAVAAWCVNGAAEARNDPSSFDHNTDVWNTAWDTANYSEAADN